MMVRAARALAVASLAAVAALAPELSASAGGASNFYGIAIWENASKNNNAHVRVQVVSGYASDWLDGGFTEQTLWEGTDNDTTCKYWVEVGYTYGISHTADLAFYWAYMSPTNGYKSYRINNFQPIVGDWYDLNVAFASNISGQAWNVYIDGQLALNYPDNQPAQDPYNAPYSKCIETGAESTSPNSSLKDAISNQLQWQDPSSGQVNNTWPGSSILQVSPAYAYWLTAHWTVMDGM